MPRNRATYGLFAGLSVVALPQAIATAQEMDAAASIIGEQADDQWRASKLIGVAVFHAQGEKIGAVSEVLIDRKGMAKIVVIDVGGFLGLGRKHVGVAFDAVKWIAHEDSTRQTYNAPQKPPIGVIPKRSDTRQQTDASLGYPDRAIVNVTKAQLQKAADFQYARPTFFKSGTPYGPAGPLNVPAGPGAPP
jgi:sporulation protein YlmC with PRC-barrel domain